MHFHRARPDHQRTHRQNFAHMDQPDRNHRHTRFDRNISRAFLKRPHRSGARPPSGKSSSEIPRSWISFAPSDMVFSEARASPRITGRWPGPRQMPAQERDGK